MADLCCKRVSHSYLPPLCPPPAAGHSGTNYDTAQPVNELWAFDTKELRWEQVPQKGHIPLPRFEESYVQYAPPGSAGAQAGRMEDSAAPAFGWLAQRTRDRQRQRLLR